jgi:hypothetical protein
MVVPLLDGLVFIPSLAVVIVGRNVGASALMTWRAVDAERITARAAHPDVSFGVLTAVVKA